MEMHANDKDQKKKWKHGNSLRKWDYAMFSIFVFTTI